nr:hypothetical protein [Bradyrhizobium japonicum]
MARVVLIDPTAKTIEVIEPLSIREATIKFFGRKLTPVLRLPRGDIVLAAKAAGGDAFRLGGARPIGGPALVVGRDLGAGERASALVDLRDVTQMVRWTSIATPKEAAPQEVLIRAFEIDPERRSIEPLLIAPRTLAIQHWLGGEIRVCYRAPGGDLVLCREDATSDPYEWQKDDAVFRGRCLVVGMDARKRFSDASATLAELRTDVTFRGPM